MILVLLLFIFIFGLFVGSFVNVLVERLPKNKSPWMGRSKCDFCHHTLSPTDLIPIISFISLQGKCRYCHKKLSWQYPLMELITGLMFIGLSLVIGHWSLDFNILFISYYLLLITVFSSFLVIFATDIKYQIIPDEMLVSLGVGSLLLLIINHQSLINHLLSGLGAGSFFLIIYLVTRGKGMGFGDVKLAPVLGLFLGFPKIIIALYLSFLTGAFISIILILIGKKNWKAKIAFGPFLIFGTAVSFFSGNYLLNWYLQFFK